MQILEYIPQLAAAGAMGVGILCILRVYALLKAEQQKEDPRPAILRSIYIFMGFGLVMTLVALGIEFSRFFMGTDYGELATLTTELAKLEQQDLYALNENSNPVPIKLDAAGKTYEIAAAYPDSTFGSIPLELLQNADTYQVAKIVRGRPVLFGQLSEDKLRDLISCPPSLSEVPDPLDTYAAGRGYTPETVATNLRPSVFADIDKASPLILEVAEKADADITLRKEAVQLLIHPEVLENIDREGHNVLIRLLSSDSLRRIPYRYYELAQVYHSRYYHMEPQDPKDLERYKEFSRKYIKFFNDKSKTRGWNAKNKKDLYSYYRVATGAIGLTPACDTCLVSLTSQK